MAIEHEVEEAVLEWQARGGVGLDDWDAQGFKPTTRDGEVGNVALHRHRAAGEGREP